MIKIIKTKIKELLDGVDDIVQVFEYPENNPTGYPVAFITWEGNESSELTNAQDSVYLTYKITLVQEKLEVFKGKKDAEITTEDRAWKIETLFRENNDLGLADVLRVLPVSTEKRYDAEATRIILEVTLQIHTFANVTT